MVKGNQADKDALLQALQGIAEKYFNACGHNDIMAVSGGMLPYVLLSLISPEKAAAGISAVAGVAGMTAIPSFVVGTPFFNFGTASYRSQNPSRLVIEYQPHLSASRITEQIPKLIETLALMKGGV